jgi:hypothetical protein
MPDQVIQGLEVGVLLGIGAVLYTSVIALTKLGTAFDMHSKQDRDNFQLLRDDIKSVREIEDARRDRR